MQKNGDMRYLNQTKLDFQNGDENAHIILNSASF